MKSKASIKKGVSLPEPKLPTTKAVRDDRYYNYGHKIAYRSPSTVGKIKDAYIRSDSEGMQALYKQRRDEADRRWEKVAELARKDFSNQQIANATGYSAKTVSGIVAKLRKRGVDIPPRVKGPRNG